MTEDLQKIAKSWERHHTSTVFLDRKKDKDGLDVVCVPGYPFAYNQMLDYFQKQAYRILVRKYKKAGNIFAKKKLLDMGCGTGRWSLYFTKKGAEVTGIDISPSRIEDNKRRYPQVTFKSMPISKLKFPKESFDIINISWVLQHNPHPFQEKAVQEMLRVLKRGGFIFLMEGIYEKEETPKFSFPRSARGWAALFEKSGAEIIHKQKTLETFLPDRYVFYRNKILNKLRPALGLTVPYNQENDIFGTAVYDFLENKELQKKRKHPFLRKTYRMADQCILAILSYLSYPVECLNEATFKYYPEGNVILLMRKK